MPKVMASQPVRLRKPYMKTSDQQTRKEVNTCLKLIKKKKKGKACYLEMWRTVPEEIVKRVECGCLEEVDWE